MVFNNVFKIAFLVSAATHAAILCAGLDLSFLSTHKNGQNKNIKVNYIKSQAEIKEPLKIKAPRKALPSTPLASKIYLQKLPAPGQFINKEGPSKQVVFSKPAFIKPDVISVKKIITLPPVDTEKISNPSYISYYQIVREKIRRAAYQNYTRTEEGEVYLSFIILKAGVLKEVRLIEQKSSANPYLREVSLKSMKDASAFPAFPKGLDYPQLSFNVIISFQIE